LILLSTITSLESIEVINAQATGYYSYDPRAGIWIWIPRPWRPTYRKTLITIFIKGLPSEYSTTIIVDGKQVGSIQGESSRAFEVDRKSSHTFQVDKIVKGASYLYEDVSVGTRYVCPGNSWIVELVQREVQELIPVIVWINRTRGEYFITYVYETRTLTELAEQGHTFEYYTEHELFVMDPHGINSDEWFKEDSVVNLSAKEIVAIKEKKDERDVFQYWSVNGIPNENNVISLKINKPYVAKAIYKKEYRVKVFSEFGHPTLDKSDGWYSDGEEATISVEQEIPLEGWRGFLGGKRIFNGWYSDKGLESKMAKFTFVVDEPKNLRVEWKIDETMPIVILLMIVVLIAIITFLMLYRKGYLKDLKLVSKTKELELEIQRLKAEIEMLREQLKKKK
jgi:hypothetical protein